MHAQQKYSTSEANEFIVYCDKTKKPSKLKCSIQPTSLVVNGNTSEDKVVRLKYYNTCPPSECMPWLTACTLRIYFACMKGKAELFMKIHTLYLSANKQEGQQIPCYKLTFAQSFSCHPHILMYTKPSYSTNTTHTC